MTKTVSAVKIKGGKRGQREREKRRWAKMTTAEKTEKMAPARTAQNLKFKNGELRMRNEMSRDFSWRTSYTKLARRCKRRRT